MDCRRKPTWACGKYFTIAPKTILNHPATSPSVYLVDTIMEKTTQWYMSFPKESSVIYWHSNVCLTSMHLGAVGRSTNTSVLRIWISPFQNWITWRKDTLWICKHYTLMTWTLHFIWGDSAAHQATIFLNRF